MLKEMLNYSAISTKIKAMDSNIIDQKDLQTLANLQSVAEYVDFLRQHPSYKEIFTDFDATNVQRGKIETLLTNAKYKDYVKIFQFASMEQRKFLNIYFSRFEIDMIKTCLRMVFDERDIVYDLSAFKEFFLNHSKIDFTKLSMSKDLDECINSLANTEYYRVLKRISENSTTNTLFAYEIGIDSYYFKKFWKYTDKYLKGAEREMIKKMIGKQIDLLNISCLYRAKNTFQVYDTSLYSYIIPINYHLNKEELDQLVNASSIDEFMSIFSETYYGKYQIDDDMMKIDKYYLRTMEKIHTSNFKNNPYSVACVIYFLFRRQREVHKLIIALECIRYKLDASESLKYLMGGGDDS